MKVVTTGLLAVREIENLWIPMPDGVRLAARVWMPVDAERHPVPAIVEYIPYRKRDGTAYRDGVMQPYIAGHGYAVLRIDVRGTGDSEGLITDEYTRQEHDDALSAFEWIVAQPWCSGRIGMLGVSWGGFNALQVAARHPPALAAVITLCASEDRYSDDAHYMGGCVLNENIIWGSAIFAQAVLPPDPLIVGERWRDMWLDRLRASPLWTPQWLEHQRRDAYWKYGSVSEDYSAIRCPVYAIGGWADAYRNAVPRLLKHLSVPCKGLIGPWCHGWPLLGEPGEPIGFLQEALRWWDRWLKDIDTGIMEEPRYRVWMQQPTPRTVDRAEQPGRWVAEERWPSPRIAARRLWLDRNRLVARPGAEEALTHSSVQYNGRESGAWCPYGGDLDTDQRSDDGYSLVFDSAPLASGFEILGAPVIELDLAADRPCALVILRLCDLDEHGASARVSYGALNLTHRDSHEDPTPLEPGRRYRVRVQLNDIAYAFPAGHRIRLALSTSYWPTVWPSPETVTLTVYTGASVLELPERPQRQDDALLAPFGEPEGAAEPAMTTLTPGHGRREWTHGARADRAESMAEHDSGMERFDAIDLAAGVKLTERYSIVGEDPLTAHGSLAWIIRRERASWRIRIEAKMQLTCTAKSFVVDQSLAAFEGDTQIHSQDWHREIARDLA